MASAAPPVVPLAALNAMDLQAFLAAFGDIAGALPSVAAPSHALPSAAAPSHSLPVAAAPSHALRLPSEKSEWVAARAHESLPFATKVQLNYYHLSPFFLAA